MMKRSSDRGKPCGIPLFIVCILLGLPGYMDDMFLVAMKFQI